MRDAVRVLPLYCTGARRQACVPNLPCKALLYASTVSSSTKVEGRRLPQG